LGTFLQTGRVRGSKRERIVQGAHAIATARETMALSGNCGEDWLTVRRLLEESGIAEYNQVAQDARYLRLLHKGATLRARLGELWRLQGNYRGASEAINAALLQEHFVTSIRDWRGIHVMTLHKAKGKA
jgi:DNA helicase-2/ATP-dependent DNA helicase PcrA